MVRPLPDLDAAVALADARLRAIRDELAPRSVRLPLRFWRQQAHFTTPAEAGIARKAVEGGTSPMTRILDRFEVGPAMLADRLGADLARVERLLAEPRRAPLVMLDAEDALALTDEAVEQARTDAADVLLEADWSGRGPRTLRFYRPPGLALGSTARELYGLLWRLTERSSDGTIPLDGIVFPKVEHPEEVDLLHGMLTEAERALGLPLGGIRVAYLVESGWAAAQLPAIAQRAADRLCALVFGLADYSADIGLRSIANEHPLADWARPRHPRWSPVPSPRAGARWRCSGGRCPRSSPPGRTPARTVDRLPVARWPPAARPPSPTPRGTPPGCHPAAGRVRAPPP